MTFWLIHYWKGDMENIWRLYTLGEKNEKKLQIILKPSSSLLAKVTVLHKLCSVFTTEAILITFCQFVKLILASNMQLACTYPGLLVAFSVFDRSALFWQSRTTICGPWNWLHWTLLPSSTKNKNKYATKTNISDFFFYTSKARKDVLTFG